MKPSHLTTTRTIFALSLLALLLFVTALASVLIGSTSVALSDVWNSLLHPSDVRLEVTRTILLNIRLPRVLLAIFIGSGLSIAGVTFQALLRNPLAEPYILGISSGGTVGVLLAVVSGIGLAQVVTPLFAFAGSGLVLMVVYALGHRRGFLDTNALLLSGVMVGAFFNAVILLFVAIVDQDIRSIYLWLLGNLANADYGSLAVVAPFILIASAGLMMQAKFFNLLAMGEESAQHLGVEVEQVKRRSYLLASLITGFTVSAGGIIGFVGLIVPHACRMLFGPDHRLLLPASFLAGASFMLVCDLLSRIVMAPSEIPVGAITAAVGAPLFIYLLKR